jgi:hypothetical protein
MADRKKAERHATIRARHPHVGGLILAVTLEPQTTKNWEVGAEGERKLGAGLDNLAGRGVIMLHDRRRPGTTANIDHLAVAPTGVWVIDAKRYAGQVSKKDVGGWFSSDVRLFVGRRDCTKLVTGMAKQVDAVRTALGAEWADVPVRRCSASSTPIGVGSRRRSSSMACWSPGRGRSASSWSGPARTHWPPSSASAPGSTSACGRRRRRRPGRRQPVDNFHGRSYTSVLRRFETLQLATVVVP